MDRKSQASLELLANDIVNGKRILFITGAGLSVASGISTYRQSKDSIWNNFVLTWGTRSKFLDDPLKWWNEFWLRTHETSDFLDAKPNAGHMAISHIVGSCNSRVITQNIDRLHPATLNIPTRLIEVHGRLGLYKCIQPRCIYEWRSSISSIDYNAFAVEGTSLEDKNLKFKKAPLCPECESPVLPQSLLFDEQYESHSFYQWDVAQDWFKMHDVYVFVGTSFSVGVTCDALEHAELYKKTMYNFNLVAENSIPKMRNILGRSEETLPMLSNYIYHLAGKPRMYFYPLSEPNELVKRYSAPARMFWPVV